MVLVTLLGLEDFRLPRTNMNGSLLQQLATYSLTVAPQEACGFIDGNTLLPCRNAAEDPQTGFRIDVTDYLAYNTDVIFHSHPVGTDSFSKHDKSIAFNLKLTSILYINELDRVDVLYPDGRLETFENNSHEDPT